MPSKRPRKPTQSPKIKRPKGLTPVAVMRFSARLEGGDVLASLERQIETLVTNMQRQKRRS